MSIAQMIAELQKGVGNECMLWTDPSLGQRIKEEDMSQLCRALRAHGGVSTLSLSGNTVDAESAAVLARYLGDECRSLRVLDLSFCGLQGGSLTTIARALSTNAHLSGVLLNASFNDIRVDGAVALSAVLSAASATSALRHLVLRYNQLQSRGVAQLVRSAHNLESLDCSYAGAVDVLDLAAALKATRCHTVRICGADFNKAQEKMLLSAAPRDCLVLDEDSPADSPNAASRGVSEEEVEEALWKEELALLHGAKARSSHAASPPQQQQQQMSAPLHPENISPTASSPPRAASSPLAAGYRTTLPPQYSPPSRSPKHAESACSEATLKSLTLALNVLHDSCSSVTQERDGLRRDLEAEQARRLAAEKEVKQLKREISQMRDDFTMQVHRLTRENTMGGSARDPSPQARRQSVSRTSSPRTYNRSSTIRRAPLADLSHNTYPDKSPHKKSPTKAKPGKSCRTPCKSPGAQTKSPPKVPSARIVRKRMGNIKPACIEL